MNNEKQNLRYQSRGYSIETAVEFLDGNIEDVPDVRTWAKRMAYSRSHFSKKIKILYGETPSQILRRLRMKNIQEKILAYPRKYSYAIAQLVGLKDDDALCHFLSYHYNTNFTELKEKLLDSNRL